MKLVWKLSISQIVVLICLGLLCFVVLTGSLSTIREMYIKEVVEKCFKRISKDIAQSAQEAVRQTALFVRLPVVMQAYEMALGGDIDDAYSPQAQAARELLRKDFAPMLDSYYKQFGNKLQLHFHLPNARSLVRLWRDTQTKVKGEALDISDDLASYRPTVLDVNRNGRMVMGIELGSGGFAIRGVIPVTAPDGRQLGSAEVLQDFAPILEAVMEEGKLAFILYVNKDRIAIASDPSNPVAIATELQDSQKNPHKGDFVRVLGTENGAVDSLITPALLSRGKHGRVFEYHGATALATLPINDYRGTQLGVLVCAMNIEGVSQLLNRAEAVLILTLLGLAVLPFISRLLSLRLLVTGPLERITGKIQDIAEDRADLSEQLPSGQKDEIGELARWFNILTAKLEIIMDEIREADERTQLMLDAMPLTANFFDKDYNVLVCNQAALTLVGVSDKREYQDRFLAFSPERQPCGRPSREMAFEYLAKAFEEGYCRTEWTHQRLDGELIPCEATLVRVKHRGNDIIAGYARDLRERNAMLEAIHNEYAKFKTMAHWYESILDAVPFPVSVQDAEMKWTFVNVALERLIGKGRQDVIGLSCSNWGVSICDTDKCAIACAQRGLKQTHFVHEGASYQVDVAVLRDMQGQTAGFLEVIQNITQLERMAKQQAEAEAANRAKSVFLATMSHEIRTPMNAILGVTEMQMQNETLSHATADAFSKIYTAGYTLLGIINDILDLSKIEAGKMELIPVQYEVASLLSDTVQLNVMRIGSKPIEFSLHVDENVPLRLFGDELRIKQVLNNLLSNAFKYTQAGGVTLSVSAEWESGDENPVITLVCRVSDTGQGMTPEQVDRLFDEYSRFYEEANRMIEGTGLGMNITQYLIQLMNGEIRVESEPGRGSTFTVRLAQGYVDSGVLGKELAENLRHFRTGAPGMKAVQIVREPMPYGSVLIVDDLETNLYVTKGLLMPYELLIDTALSGFEAIDKIRGGNKYDIVFMDHMMPKMDGVETTKKLRDMGYVRPIVALTADAVVGQAEMFLENGFDDFISKPVDLRRLDMVLNSLIRDKHPSRLMSVARRRQHGGGRAPQPPLDQQLAKIFAREAEKAHAALEAIYINKCRRDNDVRMFVINVHAMKSALANVGEAELAVVARKLEHAGREEETALILAELPAFLDKLRAVIEKIAPKEGDESSETADEDQEYLRVRLLALQAACAAYDTKAARDALTELRQKAWSRQTGEQLDVIAGYLLHSDFEEAAAVAGRLCPERSRPGGTSAGKE